VINNKCPLFQLIISSILIVIACIPTIKADKSEKTTEVEHIDDKNQTPAEDRQWQTRKKVTQVRHGHGKKIHIYLSKPKTKNKKPQNKTKDAESHADFNESDFEYTTESNLHLKKHSATETQTHGTPEMTTRSDGGKNKKFGEADNVGGESKHIETHHESVEKIKVKHHHHHHHHNHVKTIIKKEPVEKIVHVPVDKIVEKIVHVPKVSNECT
jgi:hypothetical protein